MLPWRSLTLFFSDFLMELKQICRPIDSFDCKTQACKTKLISPSKRAWISSLWRSLFALVLRASSLNSRADAFSAAAAAPTDEAAEKVLTWLLKLMNKMGKWDFLWSPSTENSIWPDINYECPQLSSLLLASPSKHLFDGCCCSSGSRSAALQLVYVCTYIHRGSSNRVFKQVCPSIN